MRMNHAEVMCIEAKYFLMNTARTKDNYDLVSLLSKCFMLIDHHTILFYNIFDKYNLLK